MTDVSLLGEAKAITCFIENGYDVFTQFSGKSSFDFVAYKNDKLYRVEVKTTTRRSRADTGWEVQLKRVRPNRTGNNIAIFDNASCDFLCIYIQPIDKIYIIESCNVKATSALTLLDSDL